MKSVPCMVWVKRGAAQQHPEKIKLTPDQLSDIIQKQGGKLKELELSQESDDEDLSSDNETTSASSPQAKVGEKRKRNLESGSKEGEDEIAEKSDFEDEDEETLRLEDVAVYGKDEDDPNLKAKPAEDSDEEDLEVLPEDSLVCVGKVSGDFCNLEVHLYNEADHHWYCHHDIMLSSFPIAMEWINYDPYDQSTANLVAVGYMEPDIEIWDLDIIDCVEPAFTLAGQTPGKKKKKKKTLSSGHTDAVLSLAWNKHHEHVLASASADSTVGLWDLQEACMANQFKHHKDKVQALSWHPSDTQSLLSGSYDQTVLLMDCRYVEDKPKCWKLPGEVENVVWNPHNEEYFMASTDTGSLYYMDRRMDDKSVFTLKAHTDAITSVCFGTAPDKSGLLLTCSADKLVKVWDISDNKPKKVMEKDMKMGKLYCASVCPDSSSGLVFAVGGETEMQILNLKRNDSVCSYFRSSGKGPTAAGLKGIGGGDTDLATTSENPKTTTNKFLAHTEKQEVPSAASEEPSVKKKNKKKKKAEKS